MVNNEFDTTLHRGNRHNRTELKKWRNKTKVNEEKSCVPNLVAATTAEDDHRRHKKTTFRLPCSLSLFLLLVLVKQSCCCCWCRCTVVSNRMIQILESNDSNPRIPFPQVAACRWDIGLSCLRFRFVSGNGKWKNARTCMRLRVANCT